MISEEIRMTDIFISYSSKHRDLTETLAAALETEGYGVWWDQALEAYASFGQQIDAALSAARVVVVIWSQPAADSDYVIAEAREAMTRGGQSGKGRLVNLLAPGFDSNSIPKPMSEFQAHPVEGIAGVVRAVAKRWAGEKPQKLDAAGHYERATGQPVLSSKRDAISAVAHVTPALLLNARLALAPYLDIHERMAGFLEWAQSQEGKKVRGRLIHGPGGLGKARLLAEVCVYLREQGTHRVALHDEVEAILLHDDLIEHESPAHLAEPSLLFFLLKLIKNTKASKFIYDAL